MGNGFDCFSIKLQKTVRENECFCTLQQNNNHECSFFVLKVHSHTHTHSNKKLLNFLHISLKHKKNFLGIFDFVKHQLAQRENGYSCLPFKPTKKGLPIADRETTKLQVRSSWRYLQPPFPSPPFYFLF